uniref:Cytochrome b n=1 Tax=Macrocheles muscaedomesticae TaxID=406086 RepID=A0A6B9WER3_9ACAR|nr:cytochrome b [Macrocheles muscaedomesticae]QHQ98532.1 cytochrome b [Macrocheles muscaedomesticae]
MKMLRKNNILVSPINSLLIDLPAPSNISFLWNIGSLLGICLMIQIISGIFLTMHYCSDIMMAFESINHIMRDVNNMWMIRIIHANGASLFFMLIYCHIGRGIYYYSFNMMKIWNSGIIILLLLMATAFLGYVLPWGQMSYWGATVITNLLSAIPYIGNSITLWLWGGFSINNATLARFYSLHFFLPFIILTMVIIHIILLHETGSSNPMGNPSNLDKISFHPLYSLKDIVGFMLVYLLFNYITFSSPYIFFDPDNFVPANPMLTPPHIQPEWYFLFAYAILRSIPNKLGGVLALFLSILILLTLPWSMKNNFKTPTTYPINKLLFWIFSMVFILLTFLGSCLIEPPFIFMSQIMTIIYFVFFLFYPYHIKMVD